MKTLLIALLALAGSLSAASPYDQPTPEPTPTPIPADSKWFAFHKPYWSLGMKGGGALPLGELSTYNGTGPFGGVDLIYQGTRDLGTNFFFSYSSQPYKLGGGATPLNNIGLGVRLLYQVMQVEALNAWIGAGGGYYITQRTRQVLVQPVTTPVKYAAEQQNTGGLGLSFCFGTSYLITDNLAFTIDLSVVNIALAGGTADSVSIGTPALGLRYDF